MGTYIGNPKVTEGGQRKVVITDKSARELLEEILTELKKLNIQISLITDNQIEESDTN